MKKENQFLQEISSLIKIFDKAFLLLSTDKFLYNEAEMEKLYESKKISEELDEIKLDVFFMQLANEGFKEVIFNDLLIKIGKYDDLVFEKKIITNNKFLNAYFERIPQLFKIQQRIKIKEKDICDVKQYNSVHLKQEKEQIYNKYSWIKTNYYLEILIKAYNIIEKIETYFKVSLLKPTNQIFDSDITKKIFDIIVEKNYINSKSQLTFEDFNFILNLKKPKQKCTNALKVTHFAYLYKLLSDAVEKKGLKKSEWENFVIKEFNLTESTLKSRFHKTEENKIFEKIINS